MTTNGASLIQKVIAIRVKHVRVRMVTKETMAIETSTIEGDHRLEMLRANTQDGDGDHTSHLEALHLSVAEKGVHPMETHYCVALCVTVRMETSVSPDQNILLLRLTSRLLRGSDSNC
ncbi:MAG: hypothetical protein ACKPKO_45470, partial [Candidatus Fonsibacter sp.]